MTETAKIQPRRSLIFMPGLRPEIFPKALASGADIVCIDLEDGILPEDKDTARPLAIDILAKDNDTADGIERMLRINSLRSREGLADVTAILGSSVPPKALMLPKVSAPEEIRILEELLTGSHGHIRFHVIIETNRGLDACHEITQAGDRIDSLLFGGADMAAELRVKTSWSALLYARSRLVHAAASASLDLLDVPYLDLDDEAGLTAEVEACVDLGFTGKAAIHPKQIPIINKIFSPSAAEADYARRVIAAFEAGDGGLVVVDGKLIEKPVLKTLARIVAVADRLAAGN
ncbi:MAG: CoA ester lyase [Proteobacteria bacterium]|nr:CoA ester lyase [Pseudomonadota bacterium]